MSVCSLSYPACSAHVSGNIEGIHVTTVPVEKQYVTYSECVSVVLVIQHAVRMCQVTLRGIHVTTVPVEKQYVTYSECVSVVLVIQHAVRMR